MDEKTPYHRCFVIENEQARNHFVASARKTDGADVEVQGERVLVFDKLTFDHLDYHYRMKAPHLMSVADLDGEAPAPRMR